jgi:citrate synthase
MENDAVDAILQRIRRNPKNVRFSELLKVCDHHFGPPRLHGTSHRVYKTPRPGDPRINIQNDKGKTKAYQVKPVLKAIDKLEADHEPEE